jgi:hypothetical protein
MVTLFRWAVGLALSLGLGAIVIPHLLGFIRVRSGLVRHPVRPLPRVPPQLTGLVERFFFTVLVGLDTTGAAIIPIVGLMFVWLGLKMASNWNRPEQKDPTTRASAFASLLAGLVSMMFALVGGGICSGLLPSRF